ncbi:VCBS repeat-containing protein [Spirosoma sp. BT704]|uniref:VCBS repeat-containing protein n=1 Tax=Spirosoma validum TaxID=2771355 RepID=A0A927GC14_9BACT|nr:VCBS repeat-containing protein [Spirosoma validum]
MLALTACTKTDTLFEKTDSKATGVTFVNQLHETEQENVLAFEYFYNGAGVAAGDLNNDGRVDLYFTGNQVDNKLFINKGNFTFDDITVKAGVSGRSGGWKTGVTLADVNADGWLDIYVCYSGLRSDPLRRNQLFINNHNLTFTDRAAEYGLDDAGYSVQANFFDYDLDGDLDCFLINHNLKNYQRKEAAIVRNERDYNAGDKLFRNNRTPDSSSTIRFTDVSEQAGIKGNPMGFGLGVSVSDLNNDGYPDVYVTNDFVEDDYCYMNQRNGTFRDELRNRVEHTSYSAMGADVADLNNDDRPDIMTLDMLPESNARQKLLPWPDNWNVYQAQLKNGFWHQNMRNMLQIQQPNGQFTEIGQLSGVSGTDWSWGVVLADFDLDGYKDIFVSNGIPHDFTDNDFIKFSDEATSLPVLDQIRQMPSTPTKNYIFRNNHNLTFTNKQAAWGFDEPTISNGCAYADLDNDGDLEIITNNLNEPARIYRNKQQETTSTDYLAIQLKGPTANMFGVGAKVTVETDSLKQVQEYFPTRGFESCSHGDLLFGLGNESKAIRVTVRWPDGKTQMLNNVQPNQRLLLDYRQARVGNAPKAVTVDKLLFEPVSEIDYTHKVDSTSNFDGQILLPMQYSVAGPRMAVGDINGDGLSDLFICGNTRQPGQLFYQMPTGPFEAKTISDLAGKVSMDAVLADFNGDKQPDLYVVNGGYSIREDEKRQDQLWLNNKGIFAPKSLPNETENGSCVKTIDIDRDGDLDLFVGGSIRSLRFPAADESFVLINDGKANFTKQPLGQLGMVSDAAVLDIDKDGWQDVVIVGEWMPVTVLLNHEGKLSSTNIKAYENLAGWWNRVEKADLDGDGDEDLVVGNLGLNTQIRANEEQPATLTYDDFDQNGTLDFFMSYVVQGKTYPAYSRDEICEQVPSLRKRFTTYKAYANATIENCFDEQQLRQAKTKQITELQTLVLENKDGDFVPRSLPLAAQYAPVFGILADDFDHNGTTDLLLMGNNSRMRLRIGKVDANHGLVLSNKGKWQFDEISSSKTGLYVRGDVRDVKKVGAYVAIGISGQNALTFKQQGAKR